MGGGKVGGACEVEKKCGSLSGGGTRRCGRLGEGVMGGGGGERGTCWISGGGRRSGGEGRGGREAWSVRLCWYLWVCRWG